ncbi:N-acetyltransferase [Jannaschia pagri]|uniref:N-acetyltransferase n=1 Tax=Jannaschia pagri TaxID=2829797 RepID=A0ABQ4NPS5_9RHOB|nr:MULTISPECIES: GNAT family N-acetyltransferase [unclassified Jannaschia]GIT92762.1 N-acetyltransferase [Jannaschia sp. AI_61]GIT96378.1 N-acetyltransferase [Jannaschia sp. AI_62]
MQISIERSDALTDEVLAIRRAVFIDEQGIPEADELDGTDGGCTHWILREGGVAVATIRTKSDGRTLKIGRVATLSQARGRGYAARLMADALETARSQGVARLYLSAQQDVVPWYARFGFAAYGAPYDDGGIPHFDMELLLDPQAQAAD